MTNENKYYFDKLDEVITDELFIGSSTSALNEEIDNNKWTIDATQREIETLTTKDFVTFFDKVIDNRLSQIRAAKKHGMIFYLWFDKQACQLRFCLISDFHAELPFGSSIELVESSEIIFKQFLNSPYHDGIPFDELVITDYSAGNDFPEPIARNPTLVYKTILS